MGNVVAEAKIPYREGTGSITLRDDIFFSLCARSDKRLVQRILRVVTGVDSLTVTWVRSKVKMEDLYSKIPEMDVVAQGKGGELYNIEMQNKHMDKASLFSRSSYHLARLASDSIEKGERHWSKRVPVTVVFLLDWDPLSRNLPVYHARMRFDEDYDLLLKDDCAILFVNCKYKGEDAVGHLVHDLACSDPESMYYEDIASVVTAERERESGMQMYKRTFWGPNIEAYADRRVEEALAKAQSVWEKERFELKVRSEKRERELLERERELRAIKKRETEAVKEKEEQVLNFLATGKLTREEVATCLKVPLQAVERIADCGKSR